MTIELDYLQHTCNTYLNSFRQKRQLTKELELYHIRQYQDHDNQDSLNILVESCMSFVQVIAKEFKNYSNIQFIDLVQEGSIGLLIAIKKYDIKSDIRLLTYASYWIRAYMYEYIVKNAKIYKIVSNSQQRKLFFNIRRYRDGRSLTDVEIEMISKELNVDKSDVIDMERKLFTQDVYLDHLNDDDGNFQTPTFDTTDLIDHNNDVCENFLNENHTHDIIVCVHKAVNALPEKQRYVVNNRLLSEQKATLETIGKQICVTSERVRQIEKNAIEMLRDALEPMLVDIEYNF